MPKTPETVEPPSADDGRVHQSTDASKSEVRPSPQPIRDPFERRERLIVMSRGRVVEVIPTN